MDNVIIVPDVHCREFWKPVLDITDKKIVFLGDYLDPYSHEDTSIPEGISNLQKIIEFKKQNPQRVTLLFGNHDFNYLWQKNWASRFAPEFSVEVNKIFMDNINLFDPYKIIDDVIFTHAGISNGWYKVHSIKNIVSFLDKQWNEFLQNPTEESYLAIFDCGATRYGYAPFGGIFWNDLDEVYSNPIDYVQIFGHSQLRITGHFVDFTKKVGFSGKPMYCCDSRAIFVYSNNELKEYAKD